MKMEPLLDAEIMNPLLSLDAALNFRSSLIENSYKYSFTPDIKELGLLDFVDLSKFEPTSDDISKKNRNDLSVPSPNSKSNKTSNEVEDQAIDGKIIHPSGNKSLKISKEIPLQFCIEEFSIIKNESSSLLLVSNDVLYSNNLMNSDELQAITKVERETLKNHFIVVDSSKVFKLKENIVPVGNGGGGDSLLNEKKILSIQLL